MSAQVISLLDRPTYTHPQVDRLLSLSTGTANRWLNGYRRGGRFYEPILRIERSTTRWVTWGEFVETRLLANYRDVDDIPTTRMRKAVEFLRADSAPSTRSPAATYTWNPMAGNCSHEPSYSPT